MREHSIKFRLSPVIRARDKAGFLDDRNHNETPARYIVRYYQTRNYDWAVSASSRDRASTPWNAILGKTTRFKSSRIALLGISMLDAVLPAYFTRSQDGQFRIIGRPHKNLKFLIFNSSLSESEILIIFIAVGS